MTHVHEPMVCPTCGKGYIVAEEMNTVHCSACRATWGLVFDHGSNLFTMARHPDRVFTIVGELADKEIER